MSEKLLKILLEELGVLRIACGCGTVLDVPLNLLDKPGQMVACPGCNAVLRQSRP